MSKAPCTYVVQNLSELQNALGDSPSEIEKVENKFEAPLSVNDAAFLQSAMQVFGGGGASIGRPASAVQLTQGWSGQGLEFSAPYLLRGLCVSVSGEGFGFGLEGNQIGTQAQYALYGMPRSPTELKYINDGSALLCPVWWTTAGHVTPVAPTTICPAQMNWGQWTWRFIQAFLRAFSIVVKCPQGSNRVELMRVPLELIGNCCIQDSVEGFGNPRTDWIRYVRWLNNRLSDLAGGTEGGVYDPSTGALLATNPGFFIPSNVVEDEAMGLAVCGDVNPQHREIEPAGYGRYSAGAAQYKWYEAIEGIIIDEGIPLQVTLETTPGSADEIYWTRMVNEIAMQPCLAPVPGSLGGTGTKVCAVENGYSITFETAMTRVPAGAVNINVGLKGTFMTRPMCESLIKVKNECGVAGFQQALKYRGRGVVTEPGLSGLGMKDPNGPGCACSR